MMVMQNFNNQDPMQQQHFPQIAPQALPPQPQFAMQQAPPAHQMLPLQQQGAANLNLQPQQQQPMMMMVPQGQQQQPMPQQQQGPVFLPNNAIPLNAPMMPQTFPLPQQQNAIPATLPPSFPQQIMQPMQGAGFGLDAKLPSSIDDQHYPCGTLKRKAKVVHRPPPVPDMDPNDKGPKQLIINYIAAPVQEKELYDLFVQFGVLECAKIIQDKETGGTKGFGFVYFASSADAATAMEKLQGFELYGKFIRVGYAVPQRPYPAIGGYRGVPKDTPSE